MGREEACGPGGSRSQPQSASSALTGDSWLPRAAPPSVHGRLCWHRVLMCLGPYSLGEQRTRGRRRRDIIAIGMSQSAYF